MEQGGRNERGDIGDQEAHICQLEAENWELHRANEPPKTPSAPRVADIPYVRAQAGWACASFITNAHSRRPHAPPGGRVPEPRGYRQRLWPCRANIQPDDRRAGREEGGTRLATFTQSPRARRPSATASRTFHRTKHDPVPHTHTHR